MESAGTERGKEIRKRPAGDGKWQEDAKKILNRGNEPKDLLKTEHLAFFGTKNELNFECKNEQIKAKKQGLGGGFHVTGGGGLKQGRRLKYEV
jgi:hypothetical protein